MKFNQKFPILFWLFRKKKNKHGLMPIYAWITIDGVSKITHFLRLK